MSYIYTWWYVPLCTLRNYFFNFAAVETFIIHHHIIIIGTSLLSEHCTPALCSGHMYTHSLTSHEIIMKMNKNNIKQYIFKSSVNFSRLFLVIFTKP